MISNEPWCLWQRWCPHYREYHPGMHFNVSRPFSNNFLRIIVNSFKSGLSNAPMTYLTMSHELSGTSITQPEEHTGKELLKKHWPQSNAMMNGKTSQHQYLLYCELKQSVSTGWGQHGYRRMDAGVSHFVYRGTNQPPNAAALLCQPPPQTNPYVKVLQ